jgi:hypothetical protein
MTVSEAAQYARCSTSQIRRAASPGPHGEPPLLRPGRPVTYDSVDGSKNARLVFRRCDIDAWLFPADPEPPAPRPRRRQVPLSPLQMPLVEPTPIDPRGRGRRRSR